MEDSTPRSVRVQRIAHSQAAAEDEAEKIRHVSAKNPPQSVRIDRIQQAMANQEVENPSTVPDKRLLAVCFPKCGTNLLKQLLYAGGQISIGFDTFWGLNTQEERPRVCEELKEFFGPFHGHVPYFPGYIEAIESKPTIVVFLIRDPRDQIVSHYYWNLKAPYMGTNWKFSDGTTLLDKEDGILALVETASYRWEGFLGWLEHPGVIIVRYEELINDPFPFLQKIAAIARKTSLWHHNAISDADTMAKRAKDSRYRSDTFRKGIVGDWRNEFKPHHIEVFNLHCSTLMEILGYPLEEALA